MKKILKITKIIVILMIFITLVSNVKVYAAELTTLDIQTSKTTVRPGEEVTLNINFGQSLGAYTFKIAYDNAIFEYVSAEGGTATDTSDKITVLYYDSTGGVNPRSSMSVTFRAKSDITTSNPTEFSITAEGLSNNDASNVFDDITVPIIKNVIVEPEFVDYSLKLEYTGDVIVDEPKEMKISYSSSMGRYYEHARLIAEATTPEGGTVKLKAIDTNKLEHDIIQSGWGDAQGYSIGGENFAQILNVEGIFNKEGKYSITLKLIDRDDSDNPIAEKTFDIVVGTGIAQTPTDTNTTNQVVGNTTINANTTTNTVTNTANATNIQNTTTPSTLPKTGTNVYIPVLIIISCLVGFFVYYNKRK